MKQPYISVIIPSFMPKEYLWQCLDSLYRQSMPKEYYEVILVLNGCKEPYVTQITQYAEKQLCGMQFHFVQTNIGGVSNARNVAMEMAQGEFLTFIDDDDYVSSKYLEGLASAATEDTVSLSDIKAFVDGTDVFSDYYFSNEHNRMTEGRRYPINDSRRQFAVIYTKLIHRSIIADRKFDTRLKNSEDSLFAFTISDNIKYVTTTPSTCIYYRRLRENSALTRHKTFKEIWRIFYSFNIATISTYMKHPWKYNFFFFITRILASCHGLIDNLKMNILYKHE